jgi:hypothetical protein
MLDAIELVELARELEVDGRTLRRAVADGTIRCERLSARRRIERAVGRHVDVARLNRVQATAPLLLLLRALDEGRVAGDASARSKDDARAAELDRIDAKLERLADQREALRRRLSRNA